MVASRLSALSAKGIDAATTSVTGGGNSGNGSGGTDPLDVQQRAASASTTEGTSSSSSFPSSGMPSSSENKEYSAAPSDYWTQAKSSIQNTYDDAKFRIGDILSQFFSSDEDLIGQQQQPQLHQPAERGMEVSASTNSLSSHLSPAALPRKSPELRSILKNPYSNVNNGRYHSPSSLSAVRSLLSLVPVEQQQQQQQSRSQLSPRATKITEAKRERDEDYDESDQKQTRHMLFAHQSSTSSDLGAPRIAAGTPNELFDSISSLPPAGKGGGGIPAGKYDTASTPAVSDAVVASRLAEGTIRALRDLALDEAVDLHVALRFWTERWERPALSWLEAGPTVWFSPGGYNHRLVGQRVSQIQAVLARRCAAIGELQQHLLRAGWQKGVAQWGVLGQGGQWATIAGGDGMMDERDADNFAASKLSVDAGESPEYSKTQRNDSADAVPASSHSPRTGGEDEGTDSKDTEPAAEIQLLSHSARIGGQNEGVVSAAPKTTKPKLARSKLPRKQRVPKYYGNTSNVFVHNARGGGILSNDPALAAWSVDAIRIVRDQIYRAGNGASQLPYINNWPQEERQVLGTRNLVTEPGDKDVRDNKPLLNHDDNLSLPLWATEDFGSTSVESAFASEEDDTVDPKGSRGDVVISDLPLMASELSALLDSMEVQMEKQRNRRLEKLRPPNRLRRSWYVATVLFPAGGYIAYKLVKEGTAIQLGKLVIDKILSFFAEHVSEPIKSIYYELLTRRERENISDRRARMDAMETLKNMIKSWLDDTYPNMPEDERISRSKAMDISLVEQRKEESIKHIYEINSVIRMSLIEMQFIKKELMNALFAMDELMSSNEININLASVTPAVLLLYAAKHISRFFFYALLKLGKSREETYASLRLVILDIERLLLMRDDPPSAPPPLSWGAHVREQDSPKKSTPYFTSGESDSRFTSDDVSASPAVATEHTVLNSDDLGMLMLHIHECRTILWEDRARFSREALRNISEDLAELAGERGAVSVKQQLQIISRMCRTYPFLKVISTGVPFEYSRFV